VLSGTCQKVILSCSECSFFAKIGRVASEEVTLQLINVKCLPALLYGLEARPLTKSDLQSLDFVINRFFTKLFTTKNIEVVKYCQEYFGFALPSVLWAKGVSKFESSFKCFFVCSVNVVLIIFVLFILLYRQILVEVGVFRRGWVNLIANFTWNGIMGRRLPNTDGVRKLERLGYLTVKTT